MATKIVRAAPIPAAHVAPSIPSSNTIIHNKMIMIKPKPLSTTPQIRFGFRSISAIKASGQSSPLVDNIKSDIYQALQGINRGIFGIPFERKSEIEGLVKLLELQNPTPDPSLNLEKVGGCWKLVYSTITILGSKRTKLGLRDFITLGDFFQIINVTEGKAVNLIKFNARGLKLLNGELTIEASFKIASRSRVDIHYSNSTITPDQLMNVFRRNYDLLLEIFNPDGWLEITYVDATMRIGRDDKGNLFILERSEESP